MAAARAVLEREEDLRTMAHEELDRWLDQLEAETVKGPTLRDLSERFLATRSPLLSACLEPVIRQPYAAELDLSRPRPCVGVGASCGAAGSMRRRSRHCTAGSPCPVRPATATRVAAGSTRWTRSWAVPRSTISPTSRSGRRG